MCPRFFLSTSICPSKHQQDVFHSIYCETEHVACAIRSYREHVPFPPFLFSGDIHLIFLCTYPSFMTWTEITFESQGRDKDTTDDSVSHNKDDHDDDGGCDYDWISLMRRFHSLAKHIITRQFWSAEWIMVGSIRD